MTRQPHDVRLRDGEKSLTLVHELSPRQVEVLRAGGLIRWMRDRI